MTKSRLLVKCLWKLAHLTQLKFRVWRYRALPGVFFRRLGPRTKIYGKIRFGNIPANISVGRECMLGSGLFLSTSDDAIIELGDRVSVNTGSHIVATTKIQIGENTMIGEYCSIRDQLHKFSELDRPMVDQGFISRPVLIGSDVWVGRGVFIGPGVVVGNGAVIGANSVVTRSIPEMAVAVGAPARVVRFRDGQGNRNGSRCQEASK